MPSRKFSYSDSEVKEMVLRCYPRLKSFIVINIGGDRQTADDIFQEAVCKLLSSRPDIDEDKIDGYLFKTVKNLCINYRTRIKKRESLESDAAVAAWNLLAAVDFEDKQVSQLPVADVREVIRTAEGFSSPMKEVFQMARIEGMTHGEIARKLGISERTVENYLRKSIIQLKKDFPKAS